MAINLRGASAAAEVAPTVGTEGRVKETQLGTILGNALESGVAVAKTYAAGREAEAKQQATEVSNQWRQTQNNIALASFDGQDDTMARIAAGFQEVEGREMTADEQGALLNYKVLKERIASARESGKPELALDIALRTAQNRVLAKHPNLKSEIVNIDDPSLLNRAVDIDAEEDKAARQRQQQALAKRDEILFANNKNPATMSELEKQQSFAKIQADGAAMQAFKQETELLAAQEGLTNAQRTANIRTAAAAHAPQATRLGMTAVLQAMEAAPGGASEKAAAGRIALSEWRQNMRKILSANGKFAISDKEVEEQFGAVMTSVGASIEDLATGKLTLEGLRNQTAIYQETVKDNLMRQVPAAAIVAATNEVLGPEGARFAAGTATYQAFVSRIVHQGAVNLGLEVQERALLDSSALFGQLPVNKTPQQQASADAQEVRAGRERPEYKNPSYKAGVANVTLSYVATPEALSRDGQIIRDQLPNMADPRFADEVKQLGVVPPAAADALITFGQQVRNTLQSEIAKVGGSEKVDIGIDAKGNLTVTPQGGWKDTKQANRVARMLADINNTVRATAHINGSTDYNSFLLDYLGAE